MISGEKKPDKALKDVTKTCEKAGGAIMKAGEKVKKSFVEMVTQKSDKGHSLGR